mmetsp:Transcript_28595/g.86243  ORF Transcript_28595/g.86243 Transcript_28595/m.86243 type:complete len:414 (+) Transcript_28595:112-1353(+)
MSDTTKLAAAAACGAAVAWLLAKRRAPAPYDAALDEVSALARPNIRALEPYRCARDDYDSGVLLDANENAYGPSLQPAAAGDKGDALVRAALAFDLHRYPCPYQRAVKDRVAAFRGVGRDNVFVGVGSDEAIDLLFRVFCEPRLANVVVTPATYGMYKVCAAAQDVEVRKADLAPETFDVDVEKIAKLADASTRLVFLCSPGNPTAKAVPEKTVRAVLEHPALQTSIVVLDEAYVDYASSPSLAPLVKEYPRLVVLHTLSKAFGLAGARCGTAIGSEATVAYLNTIKAPYSINKLTSAVAAAAFAPDALDALEKTVKATREERARLAAELAKRTTLVDTVFPSDGNFLLVRFVDRARAKALYKALADGGVVVRFRGDQANLEGCLRVTVGTTADTDAFLALLDKTAPAVGMTV